MLQLKASNGMVLSAGAQLPLPAKPPAQVPPQQIWLQAVNGDLHLEWKYAYVASSRKVVAGWLEGVFLCTL